VSGSDREFPALTIRSGTQRARDLQIRRYRQVVQDRPSLAVCWADIPGLYVSVGRCPVAWQQSQRPALDRLARRQGRADELRVAGWSNPQDNVNRRRMK
jgi:hypothetical protein